MSRKKEEPKGLIINLENYGDKEHKSEAEIDQIIHHVEGLMGYKVNRYRETLKDAELHQDCADAKSRHYYQHVMELHFLGGVPLEYFDFNSSLELFMALKNACKADESKEDVHSLFGMHGFSQNERIQHSVGQDYFEKCKAFLNNVTGSLFVYEYLDRFDRIARKDKIEYVNRHEGIFEEIENILKQSSNKGVPNMKYARFLAPPIYEDLSNLKDVDLVKEVLKKCPTSLFKHIYTCLRLYPIYEEEDGKRKYPLGFYFFDFAPRVYHFAVTIEGEYCLTEKYRFNRDKDCRLDMLLIDKMPENQNTSESLADSYHDNIIKMFKNDAPKKLSRDDIHGVFEGDVVKFKNGEPIDIESNSWLNKVKYLSNWYDLEKKCWELN